MVEGRVRAFKIRNRATPAQVLRLTELRLQDEVSDPKNLKHLLDSTKKFG